MSTSTSFSVIDGKILHWTFVNEKEIAVEMEGSANKICRNARKASLKPRGGWRLRYVWLWLLNSYRPSERSSRRKQDLNVQRVGASETSFYVRYSHEFYRHLTAVGNNHGEPGVYTVILMFVSPWTVSIIRNWRPTRCSFLVYLYQISSTCFGRCLRPSSGALDSIYSFWYSPTMLLPAGVMYEMGSESLMMGENIARNM